MDDRKRTLRAAQALAFLFLLRPAGQQKRPQAGQQGKQRARQRKNAKGRPSLPGRGVRAQEQGREHGKKRLALPPGQ